MRTIESELEEILLKMADLQIESVQQCTSEINDRIDSFYDALENEVNAKHYVDEHYNQIAEKLLCNNDIDKRNFRRGGFCSAKLSIG